MSVCLLVALLGCSAPALAGPQPVPDESALTQYVDVLAGAEGPMLARPEAASPDTSAPPSQALPARVDGALSGLPADRVSALRHLATDPSLGAPVRGVSPALTAGDAQPASSAAIVAQQPSALSAVAGAVGAASASAILLALLLILGVLAAAAARLRGQRPDMIRSTSE